MWKCRVFDKAGRELEPALSSDAICWEAEGNAFVLEYYDNIELRTIRKSYKVPLTIVLNKVVKKGKTKDNNKAPLTNYNLFARDNWTCQYCGTHENKLAKGEKLTREHIIPVSKGGPNRWDNVVTGCSICNGYKANRRPGQAGMKLLKQPHAPTVGEMQKYLANKIT